MPLLTEQDVEKISRDLEAAASGLWQEVYLELQRGGKELPIWVLISSVDTIQACFDVIMSVIKPYRDHTPETLFSISLDEYRDGKLMHWNHIEHDEISSGHIMFELGSEAFELKIDTTVYKTVNEKNLS